MAGLSKILVLKEIPTPVLYSSSYRCHCLDYTSLTHPTCPFDRPPAESSSRKQSFPRKYLRVAFLETAVINSRIDKYNGCNGNTFPYAVVYSSSTCYTAVTAYYTSLTYPACPYRSTSSRVQQPEAVLPKEISEVIHLQTPNGQWRLCKRLYHALGRTSASIPRPPDGVSDGRWATALAVTFLRRRPDVIDLTYQAYRYSRN